MAKGQKGIKMLAELKRKPAQSIFAKCPVDLAANDWYHRRGFVLEQVETTKSGREVNHWRLVL